ncbi:hypothetical protein [Xanthomonas sp. NCPPB 2632]|uniref:hypothetical protein n=1 Tax=Xanthomonas sp. NCPPB 2632 TaxID=3240912 RepID=UPI003517F916
MNLLRHARRAALFALTWSSAAALGHPAAPLDESAVHSGPYATARPAAAASTSSKASQGASMTSVAPPRSAAAVHATQQLVDFLTHLSSSSDITLERVGKQFGGALTAEDDAFVYRSADLGAGWNYGVKVILPSKAFKAGFNFWFYNPKHGADPSPICALSLDALRKQLVAHGYAEKFDRSEIGGVDSVEFVKNDLVLTVLRSNLLVAPNGDECFNAIQTIDGR